jgi:hypothetical protein
MLSEAKCLAPIFFRGDCSVRRPAEQTNRGQEKQPRDPSLRSG